MMTVVMGVGALIFIILLVYQQASAEYHHARTPDSSNASMARVNASRLSNP